MAHYICSKCGQEWEQPPMPTPCPACGQQNGIHWTNWEEIVELTYQQGERK